MFRHVSSHIWGKKIFVLQEAMQTKGKFQPGDIVLPLASATLNTVDLWFFVHQSYKRHFTSQYTTLGNYSILAAYLIACFNFDSAVWSTRLCVGFVSQQGIQDNVNQIVKIIFHWANLLFINIKHSYMNEFEIHQ